MLNLATRETYNELQYAYDYFNEHLFDGRIPACLITLQREKRTLGYFSPNKFTNANAETISELAMNPSYFGVRTIAQTLSTLVHEMIHNLQYCFGEPSRTGYHNKEWATMMIEAGLMPSHNGKEGGKKTGQQMTHYIIPGGKFESVCKQLLSEEFKLSWYDRYPPITIQVAKLKFNIDVKLLTGDPNDEPLVDDDDDDDDDDEDLVDVAYPDANLASELKTGAPVSSDLLNFAVEGFNKSHRDKYRCPNCGNQVWGKPNLKLRCGEDDCDDAEFEYLD